MAGKEPGLRRWGLAGIATVIAIALAAAAAAAASFWFVSLERERDLRDWRARLSLTAESRLAAVNGWIGGNLDALRVVAGSPDARDLVAGLVDPDREARFRGLLDGVARRSGFAVPEGASGVILLDAKGAPVPAGGGMPPLLPEQTRAVEKALAGEAAVSDIHATDKGVAVVAFAVPVPGAEGGAAGAVLGVRAVGPDLSGRLTPPDGELKSAESHLVRGQDSVVAYLTPLADGTPPLKVFMSRGTPGLVDAALLERAGNAEGVNHAGTPVLAASRAVPGTPWVLVHTVGRAEALGPGEARVRSLLIVFLLLDAAATLGVVAVWRHGAVVREAVSQERHRVAAEGFERLIRFMRTVIDIQPTEIMSCNPDNLITFANRPFAERYGVSILEIKNKPLVEVVGPVIGKTLTEANLDRQAESDLRTTLLELAQDRTVIMVTHSPTLLTACHTVVVVDKGRILLAGPSAEVLPKIMGKAPNLKRRSDDAHAHQRSAGAREEEE
ncbi:MAG: hypothetical protein HQL34_07710 [Alphaproteobacteria bacterium]|nr:hypothetical protein [Alphaproteobacteria bacterium]